MNKEQQHIIAINDLQMDFFFKKNRALVFHNLRIKFVNVLHLIKSPYNTENKRKKLQ